MVDGDGGLYGEFVVTAVVIIAGGFGFRWRDVDIFCSISIVDHL